MKSEKTHFEKIWDSLPQRKTIRAYKTYHRDAHNFFDLRYIEYTERDISTFSGEMPDPNWISQKFHEAVLGTPAGRANLPLTPPANVKFQTVTINPLDWERILRHMENDILHRDLIHNLSEPKGSIADKIIWILCHNKIGEKNKQYIQNTAIKKILDLCESKKEPLRIVLPAFPFKDQNPFRTEASPSHVDVGEIIMLARLYTLTRGLLEVLPSIGVEMLIACDGAVYSDIFGINIEEVIAYRECIRSYRNLLNMQRLVHIVDISDMLKRINEFAEVRDVIEKHLMTALEQDKAIQERFCVLMRGIKFNLNLRPYAEKYGLTILGRALDETIGDDVLAADERDLRMEIDSQATVAARKYASLHLAMSYCDIFQRFFPDSLRATIHPKPGQIGIAKDGRMLPWNGVPLLDEIGEPKLWKNIQVWELSRVFESARNQTLLRAYLEGDKDPFFYQIIDN